MSDHFICDNLLSAKKKSAIEIPGRSSVLHNEVHQMIPSESIMNWFCLFSELT